MHHSSPRRTSTTHSSATAHGPPTDPLSRDAAPSAPSAAAPHGAHASPRPSPPPSSSWRASAARCPSSSARERSDGAAEGAPVATTAFGAAVGATARAAARAAAGSAVGGTNPRDPCSSGDPCCPRDCSGAGGGSGEAAAISGIPGAARTGGGGPGISSSLSSPSLPSLSPSASPPTPLWTCTPPGDGSTGAARGGGVATSSSDCGLPGRGEPASTVPSGGAAGAMVGGAMGGGAMGGGAMGGGAMGGGTIARFFFFSSFLPPFFPSTSVPSASFFFDFFACGKRYLESMRVGRRACHKPVKASGRAGHVGFWRWARPWCCRSTVATAYRPKPCTKEMSRGERARSDQTLLRLCWCCRCMHIAMMKFPRQPRSPRGQQETPA